MLSRTFKYFVSLLLVGTLPSHALDIQAYEQSEPGDISGYIYLGGLSAETVQVTTPSHPGLSYSVKVEQATGLVYLGSYQVTDNRPLKLTVTQGKVSKTRNFVLKQPPRPVAVATPSKQPAPVEKTTAEIPPAKPVAKVPPPTPKPVPEKKPVSENIAKAAPAEKTSGKENKVLSVAPSKASQSLAKKQAQSTQTPLVSEYTTKSLWISSQKYEQAVVSKKPENKRASGDRWYPRSMTVTVDEAIRLRQMHAKEIAHE